MHTSPSLHVDQLVAFDRVVREGSFSRAAFALDIGQPAVSSRIQALEGAVGGALFTRGRRVALTALGESFLPYARRALDVLGEGVEVSRLAQGGGRGRIRLAVLGSLAGGLVGPALAHFLRAHPEVECTVKSAAHEVVVEMLLDGLVELGLVTWPCSEAVAADLTPLFVLREPVILVAHPRHALAALAEKHTVSRSDLVRLGRPLLRLRWWKSHHAQITRLADLTGTMVEVAMETARQLVLEGAGVGFFTRTFIAEDVARGQLVEVAVRDLPRLSRGSALVRRRRTVPLSPSSARLVESLRAEARRQKLLDPARDAKGSR